jgi:hypothetical protein
MARLTDDEIRTLTDAEIQDATSFVSGDIARDRAKAEYYFLGLPKGDLSPPEIEGRSSVVDTTVRNTVLGMEAPLIKTFCGTENVVEFSETQPEDAEKAKLATEYLNYILRKKNPGFQIISTWIRDSLLQKVGFIKVWWDDSAIESTEEYRAQSPEQLAMLLDDDEIEVTAQKAYEDEEAAKAKQKQLDQIHQQIMQMQGDPQLMQVIAQYEQLEAQPVPMLYDITVKRTKSGGRLCIENVPYDEMLVSRKCKRMDDDTFKAHRVIRTIGYLRAAGYKNVGDITSDESAWVTTEATERSQTSGGNQSMLNSGSLADPDMREVWITECYVKADIDGSGIAEWRKIVRAGKSLLENEPVDENPFVALHSIPLAHRFFGMSPADLAIPAQRLKTSLKRAALDNMYLQVNGRYFAVEGQVNLDDLLNSRPGGVVRIKNQGAVGRLDQGMGDIAGAMAMLENAELDAEESTGWSRSSQGGNGLQLSQTATQSNIITNRADSRVEMISRTMAETGFTDLFRKMLRLVTQYQNKAEQAKLGGKWVSIDPREWTNQFDLDIHVGLGTGNKDQQVQHLMALSQQQQLGLQVGTTTPENVYHAQVKFAEALGFKNGGEQFFTDPSKMPPRPPPVDPNVVKAQTDQQKHQAELQFKMQQGQADREHAAQIEQIKAQMQIAVDRSRQEAEAQQHALKVQNEAELARMQEELRHVQENARIELERWKAQLASDTSIYIAQLNNQAKLDTANLAADRAAEIKETQGSDDQTA